MGGTDHDDMEPEANAVPRRARGIVPFVLRLRRGVLRLAAAAFLGGALVWWWLSTRALAPPRTPRLAAWALVLLVPPLALLLVAFVLRAAAAVPDRLRRAPSEAVARAGEVARLAGEVSAARRRGLLPSLRAALRARRLVSDSRELLEIAAPLAVLLHPGTLLGAALAALAAVVEAGAGILALIALLAR